MNQVRNNPRRAPKVRVGGPLEGDYTRALVVRSRTAFQTVSLFRRNIGAIRVQDRMFKAGIPGQADVYAVADGGQHFEIEIKRHGRLSPNQERWREWCQNRGVPWALLDVVPGEMPAQTIERWVGELRRFFGV